MKVIDLLNKIANGEEVKYALKGRSAIDDNMSLTDALIDWLSINYEETEDDTNWLNDEVEILDEEDEFIDIGELNLNCISYSEDSELLEIINVEMQRCKTRINEVIKNQKKIIQALKENK